MISEEDRSWVDDTVDRYKKQYQKTAEKTTIVVEYKRDVIKVSSESIEALVLNISHLLSGERPGTERMIARWVMSLGKGATKA